MRQPIARKQDRAATRKVALGKDSKIAPAKPRTRPNVTRRARVPSSSRSAPAPRELLSQAAYARRRGISQPSVHQAIREGRISTVNGKIDPAVADREWAAHTDLSKPRNSVSGNPKATRGGRPGPAAATGYAQARAERERIRVARERLELEQRRGLLVRADEVRIAAYGQARKARDMLRAIPERVAVVLAAATEPEEAQRILEGEIERVCAEIADAERP